MLDNYKNGQPIVYKLLLQILNSSKINHAYLFQTHGAFNSTDLVISFAKSLICPYNYTNNDNCNNCNICNRIDNQNFPELKIIEPDGWWIKKEQLIELQKNFNKKALEGNKKIYIIKQVERLNSAAANSVLKFLEEPPIDIIALLITEDIYKVIPTIVSRCQVITLKPNKINNIINEYSNVENKTLIKLGIICFNDQEKLNNYLNDKNSINKLETIINFAIKLEQEKLEILVDTNNFWHNQLKTKEDFMYAFEVLVLLYKDILNYIYLNKIEIFDYYKDQIKQLSKTNDINSIKIKLNKILLLKETINNNINSKLLIDKLIISIK